VLFEAQILPIEVPQKKAKRSSSSTTNRRAKTRAWKHSQVKAGVQEDGTVTAGNAPGTNDGAAAVMSPASATLRASASSPSAASSRKPSAALSPSG